MMDRKLKLVLISVICLILIVIIIDLVIVKKNTCVDKQLVKGINELRDSV